MANVRPDKHGYGAWNATGVGTNAGVSVTHTLNSLADHSLVAGVTVSGDAAALVTVESPSGTPIWRKRFAAAFADSVTFPAGLVAASGQNVLVKISASTSNCEANISGWDVR